jgi:hypothetical protein
VQGKGVICAVTPPDVIVVVVQVLAVVVRRLRCVVCGGVRWCWRLLVRRLWWWGCVVVRVTCGGWGLASGRGREKKGGGHTVVVRITWGGWGLANEGGGKGGKGGGAYRRQLAG